MAGRQSAAMQNALAAHAKNPNISAAARLAGVSARALRCALRALGHPPGKPGRIPTLY